MKEAIQDRLAVVLQDSMKEVFSFSLDRELYSKSFQGKAWSFLEGIFRVPTVKHNIILAEQLVVGTDCTGNEEQGE